MMRHLVGERAYVSIPLENFAKEFALEPLVRATSVIVDENDVGLFINKAANLKAAVTHDVIQINRKYKTPISYKFYGFMVQCINGLPKMRDNTGSWYRRQLIIPFEKSFTGQERRYIKYDYMHRTEVLEYVLYKVLNMNYYQLSTPQASLTALSEYKVYNDPTREFLEDILPKVTWDLIPNDLLFQLYNAWFAKTQSPVIKPDGRNQFSRQVKEILSESDLGWIPTKNPVTRDNKMDGPELLLVDYKLEEWLRRDYTGTDITLKATPLPAQLQTRYRGYIRTQPDE